MNKPTPKWLGWGEWLLNRRWWLVVLACMAVLLFEYFEYQPLQRGFSIRFFFEETSYGLILPATVGFALSALAASRSELAWTTYYQNLKQNLDLQLYNVHSHTELASVILQFVKVVMPLLGASFYKYDRDDNRTKVILDWSLNKDINIQYASQACPCLVVHNEGNNMMLKSCVNAKNDPSLKNSSCFCLPFIFSDNLVGGARLYFPAEVTPSQEHVRLLNEVAPEIASAFHRIQLERLKERHDDGITAEQQRIARDVHDSLGHSLAYLSLRLSQISMESDQTGKSDVHQEVVALRDIAKEAYNQMRDVLNMLSPGDDSGIEDRLVNYANRIGQQGNFSLKIKTDGQSRDLPSVAQRNIFYIFQETLTNIGKHAHARLVNVDMKWGESGFLLDVYDDGVGFDPAILRRSGHFGLKNMQERALESEAELSIDSHSGGGTHITLRVPYKEES